MIKMFGLAPSEKFTYEEYCLLPEGDRRELIQGELLVTPSPGERHQRISGNIEFELRKYLEEAPLGVLYHAPFDVILDEHNVVQPDVLIVLTERQHVIRPEGLRGVPDLAVEILSPSTASRDRVYKRRLYHRFGVPEYWIVDPEKSTVAVLAREDDDYRERVFDRTHRLTSALLPGLGLDLERVFR